jgi:hypothetical protein
MIGLAECLVYDLAAGENTVKPVEILVVECEVTDAPL